MLIEELIDDSCQLSSLVHRLFVEQQFHRTYGKRLDNSSVLSERLKVCNVGVEVTNNISKPSQASAAAAGKA